MSELMDGQVIKRNLEAEVEVTGDGRTIDLRIVPYGVPARVSDDGGRTFYDEVWEPGVFDRQMKAAHRILMNFEHQPGIGGVVGRGVALRNSEEGAEGTFRMLSGSDADKTLELVNEGVLTGVSLEAVAEKSTRDANGVVRRIKARLEKVALCRTPAFPDAQVLAVREAPTFTFNVGAANTTATPVAVAVTPTEEQLHPDEDAPAPEPTSEPAPDRPPEETPSVRPVPPNRQPEQPGSSRVEEALARVGYQPLAKRAVTRQQWDSSAARFTDDEYQRSCLIVRDGDDPVKERASLPVLEPNGDLNAHALTDATARLHKVQATLEQKAPAARMLIRYLNQADFEIPQSLRSLASR